MHFVLWYKMLTSALAFLFVVKLFLKNNFYAFIIILVFSNHHQKLNKMQYLKHIYI